MGKRTIALGLSAMLLSGGSVFAATVRVVDGSSLVNDAAERATDSPLVRAAKRSLKARGRSGATQVVINDQYLRATGGGHFAQAVGSLPAIATGADTPTFVAPPTPQPKNTRAAVEKRVQELKTEQRNLADEADQGPYGEVGEDVVGARMTRNQGEEQNLQQQLNQPRPSQTSQARPPQ